MSTNINTGPLDDATIQSLLRGLGSNSAKTRDATIRTYAKIGTSDERINRVLRELA